jgi:26S proteasome regulatory subunit N9
MAAPLQYLETLRTAHPELAEWYTSLADLYQRKLWHQLTAKLEQFVALTVFQVRFPSLFSLSSYVNTFLLCVVLVIRVSGFLKRYVFIFAPEF